MKHVRVRTRPDPDVALPFFELLAERPFVSETRLFEWNLRERPTLLFVVDGDRERLRDGLRGLTDTEWDLAPIAERRTYLRLRVDPGPFVASMLDAVETEGVVIVKPVIYRDGEVHVGVVGASEPLQRLIDAIPSAVDVTVDGIDPGPPPRSQPIAALTDRQREALSVALELGYFEQPRQATHSDVADALGCSSSTASEHLQKAQARLVRTLFEAGYDG